MGATYGSGFITMDANPAATGHWSTKAFPPDPDLQTLVPPKLAQFEWRNHGLAPLVRDQGQWNACTSFAMASMIEARRHLRGLAAPRLSAGYAHYCRIGETDPNRGHNAPEVASVASSTGLKPGAVDGLPLSAAQCAIDAQLAVRIIGSGYCEPGAKAADRLVSDGPLLIEVPMPIGFDQLRQHTVYRVGNLERPILHSMMMMGYDWTAKTITMLGSNGPGWGNAGYATMDMTEALFFSRWPFAVTV